MTRDIRERMDKFGVAVDVQRIALNMDQIREYNPPPNPAKESDSRYSDYIKEYGGQSWELDALKPQTLHDLIVGTVSAYFDEDVREANITEMEKYKSETRDKYREVLDKINDMTA
jgi:hypothetical protein